MRDLHKVRERNSIELSVSQIYVLLGLLAIIACLVFIFGFYMGRQVPVAALASQDSLIPPEVENESVALLLARAAEEEAERSEQATLDFEFHDLLPDQGEESSEPREDSVADVPRGSTDDSVDKAQEKEADHPEPGVAEPVETSTAEQNPADGDDGGASVEDEEEPDSVSEPTGETGGDVAAAPDAERKHEEASPGEEGDQENEPLGQEAAEKKTVETSNDNKSEPKTVVSVKAPHAEAHPSARKKKGGGRPYTVQVSSFQESAVAEKLVRQLSAQGFSAYKVAAEVNGHTWYRVRVGSFDTRDQAEAVLNRLKAARSELNPMITRK